jgi:hypothetical protein
MARSINIALRKERQQKTADDRLTLALIAEAVADLEAKKAALHPESKAASGAHQGLAKFGK